MSASDDQVTQLFEKLVEVCVEIARDAHAFIGSHNLKERTFLMDKYPCLDMDYFYDNKYFDEEFRNKVPFLKYKIPKYEMKKYPDEKNYYESIFEGFRTEYINLKNYKKIEDIKKWINSEKDILSCFTSKDEISDFVIRGVVLDVVKRYLYITNATGSVPDDIEHTVRSYVAERLLFYIQDELFFDICIPVCLCTFERDMIRIDENIEIISIPEDIQKSRQVACKYEVYKEDWVAACATHMIVLHGYSCKKNKDYSFDSIMQDYSCYPLEKIDEIFGMIRLVTGYQIGYEQIFCLPKAWVYETTADLVAVYGAKAHFVNSKYIKTDWMNLPVSYVTGKQCEEIVDLYAAYKSNTKKIKFSLMRFNRCMLRDEVDDMTTDACIGLESLLAGSSHSEITNAIAARIPFVFSKVCESKYSVADGRKYMKKIYNLRSRIVHGDELKDKDIYIDTDQERIYIPHMAVDFLRLTLSFMIKNPKYLVVKEIDLYIDSLLQNNP